ALVGDETDLVADETDLVADEKRLVAVEMHLVADDTNELVEQTSLRMSRTKRLAGEQSRGNRGMNRRQGRLNPRRPRRSGGTLNEPSVHSQIAVDLPGRDVLDVVEPFLALRLNEVLEEMLAERVADQFVLLELVQRFVEIPWKLVDPQVPPLAVAHLVDV